MNITVAAGCLNQTPLDWDGNCGRIVSAINQAKRRGVSLLCLPELCVTGYGCEDLFHAPEVARTALEETLRLAEHTAGFAVAVGLPVFHQAALYNCVALLAGGRLHGLVAKQHLASDGIHYEPRWFRPWPAGVVSWAALPATKDGADAGCVPLGDVLLNLGGVKVGVEVCRDAWVARRPGAELARRGADVLLNPSASHFAFGKHATRERLALEASRAMGVVAVVANAVGNEAGRTLFDGGGIVASGGRLVAEGPRLHLGESSLTVATVELDEPRSIRGQTFAHASPEPLGDAAIRAEFDWPVAGPGSDPTPAGAGGVPAGTPEASRKHEEFTHAVTLGLWDYLRRSGAGGFVLSLSGGADSAAVAALVSLMARRVLRELGAKAATAALPGVRALSQSPENLTPEEITGRILLCVYQATENSSSTTRDAAAGLANAIGAEFTEWRIDSVVSEYTRLASRALGRDLTWDADDIALQNIQSRARAPGAWLLANATGRLLLTTGNRSEAAVGYATMDGDTCGGLAPIGAVDKAFLSEWLRWLEAEGPAGLGPLPALAAINRQQPTAELRPPAAHQTDQGDLMPYPVLAAIERAALRDRLDPAAVLRVLRAKFPGTPPERTREWVTRFYNLWRQNQWKRERYAPAFHLDDMNVDPRSWCRFPILSAAWRRELDRLPTGTADAG